ncbi:hypothetical protein ACWG0P_15695 [Amedibacillus sp. YH-ame6]
MKERNKRMKRMRVLLVLLLFFGMTIGCGNNEKPKADITKNPQDSRGVVDDFSDQLILNGKKVKIPTTLNELGYDYTFGDEPSFIYFENDEGTPCVLGNIFYKGEKYAQMLFLNTTAEEKNRDSILFGIFFDTITPQNSYSMGSLNNESTKEDIIKLLGEPDTDGNNVLQYFNKKEKNREERILIRLSDERKMEYFTISKYPEK